MQREITRSAWTRLHPSAAVRPPATAHRRFSSTTSGLGFGVSIACYGPGDPVRASAYGRAHCGKRGPVFSFGRRASLLAVAPHLLPSSPASASFSGIQHAWGTEASPSPPGAPSSVGRQRPWLPLHQARHIETPQASKQLHVLAMLGCVYYTNLARPEHGTLPPNVVDAVNGVMLDCALAGQFFCG